MMYLVWENTGIKYSPELIDFTHIDSKESLTRFYTFGGKPIEDNFPLITFEVENFEGLNTMDVLWAGSPYLVFSEKLRNVLNSAGVENIQYFPSVIKNNKTGDVNTNFAIANVVGVFPCLDWKKSDVVSAPKLVGRVRKIKSLVLDENKIPENVHIFRMYELRSVIICSDALGNLLKENNIMGVKLIIPKDYSRG